MTGLAAGISGGFPVYEARPEAGGICSSYYIAPHTTQRLNQCPEDQEAYHFELGGGHWIFGADTELCQWIERFSPLKKYQRRSAVFFPQQNCYVPFPIQNHLGHLNQEVSGKALEEICSAAAVEPVTMAGWIENRFGSTLTNLFFGPFHELYTHGLWKMVAPQDAYKSPLDLQAVRQGASGKAPAAGYNVNFVYPEYGLDVMARNMAKVCNLHYEKCVSQIDAEKKLISFKDGTNVPYDFLLSTLPLNQTVRLAGLNIEKEDPYTSVLVLNLGGLKGEHCPDQHWVYVPQSRSGFHRIGIYSAVDSSFLPGSYRHAGNHACFYVEKSFAGGARPAQAEVEAYCAEVIKELKQWGYLKEVEVADPTWIEVAYTWRLPGSQWVETATERLREKNIFTAGRYGKWKFQGIAESLRDGFCAAEMLHSF